MITTSRIDAAGVRADEKSGPPLRARYDVIIAGAGPVGLTLANFLGMHGLQVLVAEKLPGLIDYPRGVGMDDECLRVFQAIGLAERVTAHTTPDHWLRFMTTHGRCFASIEPRTRVFGWPRRNAFVQPLVDRVLLEGLSRFDSVAVAFGHELLGIRQTDNGAEAVIQTPAGDEAIVECSYLVGCDGGKSATRKAIGVAFAGVTESTQWLVVDVRNDPVGSPDAYLVCDSTRPYVSIALPHGIRRFEFQVMPGETEQELSTPAGLQNLLAKVVPDPGAVDIIRSRAYTHHARLAGRFRVGRILLAGDAAHLMPVWQGQGYNSGIRDANNLAWKLAAVCKGKLGDKLLDSYEAERRNHAAAMISLSLTAGRIFAPSRRWMAALRDGLTLALNLVPAVKDYFLQMRFKPMPRYEEGAIVRSELGRRDAQSSPVGQLFIQPRVSTHKGPQRLDDALGNGLAMIAWGSDPTIYLDDEARRLWDLIEGRIVVITPETQFAAREAGIDERVLQVGDVDGDLKTWFSGHAPSVLFIRPDRFVAAACRPQQVSATVRALARALDLVQGDGDIST